MSNSKRCPFCKGWIPLPIREPDRAFNRHKKECDPDGYARQVAFTADLLGGPDPMSEIDTEIAEPTKTKASRAKEKAPKEPKPAKEPRPSKFPGTYTIQDAIRVADEAAAAGEKFDTGRSYTVAVGGNIVAPKWLTTKLTGIPSSDFSTADAVKFLAGIGLVAQKADS